MNGNGKTVTILLAVCMFLAGLVVAGLGGVIRGDYLGRQAALEVEARVNQRIDRTLTSTDKALQEINRRLERIEDKR